MFQMIGFIIKFFIFSLAILILGNWIHWGPLSLSDHIKVKMAQVQRTSAFSHFSQSLREIKEQARFSEPSNDGPPQTTPSGLSSGIAATAPKEEISESEQEELDLLLKAYRKQSKKR